MVNGKPAYSVIMIHQDKQNFLKGYAYMNISAVDYIKSLPTTTQTYVDPDSNPNKPAHRLDFFIPNKITTEGFYLESTDRFEWAKNSEDARSNIIQSFKPLHFQSNFIIKDLVKRYLGFGTSKLDIRTEDMETPLIKDHLEVLERWWKEDNAVTEDEMGSLKRRSEFKEKLAMKRNMLKEQRHNGRLNDIKKRYIITKPENILPFEMTLPPGAMLTNERLLPARELEQNIKLRLGWINKAVPNNVFIQLTLNEYGEIDLFNLSGYIYHRKVSHLYKGGKICMASKL